MWMNCAGRESRKGPRSVNPELPRGGASSISATWNNLKDRCDAEDEMHEYRPEYDEYGPFVHDLATAVTVRLIVTS